MRSSTSDPVPLIWTQPPPPPRQRALGREEIVAAAIDLADEAGLDAITMKAVAARLGPCTPMALYRYVHNKDGLVDLMLDKAVAEISLPEHPTGDWRSDLRALATDTRQMTSRHPWYALLVHTRPPAGPHMMRRLEFMLTVLIRQGATVSEAMNYAALIDRQIFGSALQEAEETRLSQRYGLDDSTKLYAAIATLRDLAVADGNLPHLTDWLTKPTGPTTDEQFALGLDFLLDGIARRLPTPPGASDPTRRTTTDLDRGKLKGKQPKLTARQQAELVRMHATGDYTIAELMEVFSVGRATVYRVLDRAKTTGTTDAETPR